MKDGPGIHQLEVAPYELQDAHAWKTAWGRTACPPSSQQAPTLPSTAAQTALNQSHKGHSLAVAFRDRLSATRWSVSVLKGAYTP